MAKNLPTELDKSRLLAEQDQDEMDAKQWWQSTSTEDKLAVWLQIQAMGNHTMKNGELISRFAQLGYTRMALLGQEAES